MQEKRKAKFENEKNKSIAFLHKTFTRKLNFSFHCFSDAIFLCFSIILYLWIGIIPLFLIFQFTLLFMLPSFPRQTRNRRIYFLDTSLKVRNRKWEKESEKIREREIQCENEREAEREAESKREVDAEGESKREVERKREWDREIDRENVRKTVRERER